MQKIADLVRSAHRRFVLAANGAQSPLLLLVRLFWGWQFAEAGWGKLHNLAHVADFFTSLGLPAPAQTALFVASVEFVGGILLALGVGSRMVSLVLFINMTVAYWMADRDAFLGVLSAPDKFYAADPFTFWFAALLILVFGPGLFAVDTLIARWCGAQHKN